MQQNAGAPLALHQTSASIATAIINHTDRHYSASITPPPPSLIIQRGLFKTFLEILIPRVRTGFRDDFNLFDFSISQGGTKVDVDFYETKFILTRDLYLTEGKASKETRNHNNVFLSFF